MKENHGFRRLELIQLFYATEHVASSFTGRLHIAGYRAAQVKKATAATSAGLAPRM